MKSKIHLPETPGSALFYVSYAIFMIATVLQTTMYSYNQYTERLFELMRYGAFVLVAVKVIIDLVQEFKAAKGNSSLKKQFLARIGKYALMSGLVLAVSITADERSLIFLLAFLIGAKGEDVKKIFRFTMYLQIFLMVYVILSAELGFIKDLMFERNGVYTRHSLGYWFPSYVMSYYFFILLMKFWTETKPIPLRDIGIYEAINMLLYILTDARLGLVINTVVILVAFVYSSNRTYNITNNIVKRVGQKKGLAKVIAVILDGTPVWLSILTALLCRFPYSIPTVWANYFLSDRFTLTLNAFFGYGIHLLGNPIEWVGYGGRTNMFSVATTYNFVDNAYPFILYQYGLLLFLGVLWIGVLTARDVRRTGDWYRYTFYILIFLYCFVEPRLIELNMNTFMFLSVPLITRVPSFRKDKGLQS